MKKGFVFLSSFLLLVARDMNSVEEDTDSQNEKDTSITEVEKENSTENEANELISNNAVIIDVRSSIEYESGHIVNAINIPVDNIGSVDYDKDTVIIVYCASGVRSDNAADALIDLGYTNVYNLDGGLINWGAELE